MPRDRDHRILPLARAQLGAFLDAEDPSMEVFPMVNNSDGANWIPGVADFLKDRWIYKRLFGPAGQQLVTEFESAEMLFGQIDYDLGIIAGSRTIDPISSLINGVPNDGKVSVENTEVLGMTDHVIVSVTHAFLPYRRIVHHLVLQFRRSARFEC